MAIIPLRQYNREIEGLIDTEQLDEAVAHCRHILETFPKHIATYRLLGKAYMEQQRYSDATDIFQRVLSSVPDDHVANIGLSIIREDEGNLDASIWYMERALEAQPSNAAIKDELRRLYGRRDGIEPPKIRLTRGALARMYSRGGLYDQAVAELRAALADDPQRPDLMVLLAQMHFYLGQQVEAVDICGTVMKQLPYCLVANRILASILPQTGRADDTKTYHQRTIAMDPYFSSASQQALTADTVPESAIKIERLEYRPGQQPGGPTQPAWAASLGIAFEENQPDQLPEWLRDQGNLEEISKPETRSIPAEPFSWETSDDEISPLEEPARVEDIIPDWMKEAGWQPATGEATEELASAELEFPVEEQDDEIVKAEIPDWLQDLAPSSELDEELSSDQGEIELPWLQQTTPGASDTIVNWLGAKKQAPELGEESDIEPPAEIEDKTPQPDSASRGENGGLPDWLQGVEATYGKSGITDWLKSSRLEEYEAASALQKHHPDDAAESEGEVPEWSEEIEEAALPAEELPDWLKEMGEISPKPELSEQPAEEDASPAEELPDWLIEMGEAAPEPAILEQAAQEIMPQTEELPDWIEEKVEEVTGLAFIEPTAEEVDLTVEDVPEWLTEEGQTEEPALADEELTEWLTETDRLKHPEATVLLAEDAVEEEPALADIDIPDWLQDFEQPESTDIEVSPIKPTLEEENTPTEEVPIWLKDTAELALPAIEAEEDVISAVQEEIIEGAVPADETPEWLRELEQPPVEATTPFDDQAGEDAALAWLESLAAKHSPQEEELSTKAEEPPSESVTPFIDQAEQDAALAWLEKLAAQQGAKEEELITRPEERLDEIPDWIKSSTYDIEQGEEIHPQITEEEAPASPAEDLPEWLKEITASEEERPTLELTAEEPIHPSSESSALSEELPEWLREAAEPASTILPVKTEAEEAVLPAEEPIPTAEELPDWLQELAESTDAVEAGEELTPAFATPEGVADEDAALAWLEGLAAQQGAKEEELITRPEERRETMPDWIIHDIESQEEAEEAPTQPVPVAQTDLAEAMVEEPEDQIQDQIEIVEEIIAPELAHLLPEDTALLTEELPDWLSDTGISGDAQERTEPQAEIEQLTDWFKETATPQQGVTSEEPDSDLEKLPEWLRETDQLSSEEGEALPSPERTATPAWMPEAILPEAELPAAPSPPLKVPSELEEIEHEFPEPEQATIPSELPDEIININTAPLSQLENLTGIGFILGQRIIEYRETNGPFTEIDELKNVSGIGPVAIDNLRERLTTGIPVKSEQAIQIAETKDWLFSQARDAVEKGDVEHAAELYTKLIAQGADLEQLIGDMQDALYRFPLDISIWQSLGDAYLRTDKLQEALDAYTKAEELLR